MTSPIDVNNYVSKCLERVDSDSLENDAMLRFTILMLAFNAKYANLRGSDNGVGNDVSKLKSLFQANSQKVRQILAERNSQLQKLAEYIANTEQHSELNKDLVTRRGFLNSRNPDLNDFAGFVMKVRNNMFHAMKMWDENEELKLLDVLNPVLRDIIEAITRGSQDSRGMG